MFQPFAPCSSVSPPTVTLSTLSSTRTLSPISFTSIPTTISSPFPAARPVITLFKKIAVSLVTGSILFVGFGCLSRPTPALALLPVQKGGECETIGKKRKEEVGDVEIMWERYLEQSPKDVDALKILVYEKLRKGKNGEAVKYVERLMELERHEVEWRLLEAFCYEMMGDYSGAKKLFKDILKERPLLVRALHGVAMVMHKNNEGPAMYDMLDEALELAQRGKRVTEARI